MTDLDDIFEMGDGVELEPIPEVRPETAKVRLTEAGGLHVLISEALAREIGLSPENANVSVRYIPTADAKHLIIQPKESGLFKAARSGSTGGAMRIKIGRPKWVPAIIHNAHLCEHRVQNGMLAIELPDWDSFETEEAA